ncbi:MAG: LptF/LptG family permease [Heliobacteriaceae bacterium]|jgi:lipopolysaccharide export system permease protein|nr:LptF/LptG family permease [Heliobacteriaceae bacterium]
MKNSSFCSVKIYDRYIFKQVFFATIAAILLFTVVWIAPEMLLNTIKKTLSGAFGIKTAALIIFYELPKILGKAFPVGLLLGTLFTFDKLSKDSELTIFRAAGLSFWRIAAPVIVLSLIVTYLCFVTYDKLIPASAEKLNAMGSHNPVTQYIYTQKGENNTPVMAVIVSRYRNKHMNNVVVLNFAPKMYSDVHQLSDIYFARTGETLPDKWHLNDITHYKISNDGIFFDIDKIKDMDILQGKSAQNAFTLMTYATKKEREINNHDLWNYIKLLKREDLDEEYRYMLNKYLQRFFHPFVCVLLAIMGALLGFSRPREHKLVGFTIAIGCIFLYYITLPFFDLLAEKGIMHPFLTAVFPPAAFLCAIAAFYKSKEL